MYREAPRRWVGDFQVDFGNRGQERPRASRTEAPWSEAYTSVDSAEVTIQEPAETWRGFPLVTTSEGPWTLWLLGELVQGQDESLLLDVANGRRPAAELNGHFLLFGHDVDTRTWHAWTNRMGTLHGYIGGAAGRKSMGTYHRRVASGSQGELDWEALTYFLACAHFPGSRTHFKDVSFLAPATHHVFSDSGELLSATRYWDWWHRPESRTLRAAAVEFADVFGEIMDEMLRGGTVALPISGGLDSRSTVAFVTARDDVWPYSYGYGEDSIETRIAGQVARARGLPCHLFSIPGYLFDRAPLVTASLEGFVDFTQCRQAAISTQLRDNARYIIAAHGGDIWMDRLTADRIADPVEVALSKVLVPGRRWLLEHVARSQLGGSVGRAEEVIRGFVESGLAHVEHVADRDFRVKAWKVHSYCNRGTNSTYRMFQAAVFPRLPFFDNRMVDYFCRMETQRVAGRQVQIEFLKRYAPELARVPWQDHGLNLFMLPLSPLLNFPILAAKKVRRIVTRRERPPQRNWEVQFLGRKDRLQAHLTRPGLALHELVPRQDVVRLVDDFYREPDRNRGYAVSSLFGLASWLEHGRPL